MTLDPSAAQDPLAGGTLTLDGHVFTVPRNLLATLPSITVAWPELFDPTTGLANLPGNVTWEAHVSFTVPNSRS